MSILTSPTQYLQPEYLSPASHTQADTKNSPLALLVATCNSIGKDNPNAPKSSLVPTLEKERRPAEQNGGQNGGRLSSTSGRTSRSLTPPPPPNVDIKEKHGSPKKDMNGLASDSLNRRSPLHIKASHVSNGQKDDYRSSSISPAKADDKLAALERDSNSAKYSSNNSISSKLTPSSVYTSASTPLPSSARKSELGQPLPGLAQYAAHMSSLPGLPGYPYSLLGGSTSAAATAALYAAHKHNPESVKYTPVRTASGATTLIPLCSDPYCTHCKLTLQAAQLSPTSTCSPAADSVHDRAAAVGLPPHYLSSSLPTGLLGLPGLPPSLHGSGGLGSKSLLTSAAAAQNINSAQPYVCSWIATGTGSGVCGKRFASSEDLMQHLRTHTASLDSAAAAAAAAHSQPSLLSGLSSYPAAISTASALSAAAAAGGAHNAHLLHAAAANSALSPSLLRSAYSGRLSPSASLLSSSRFHPYLKSLPSLSGGLPSESALPPPPLHPSLGAYSSLYSLYGHKLGVP